MIEWYQSLVPLEKVYFYIAIIASVFLVVQIILMLVSGVGADGDVDGFDVEVDVDGDSGVSLFTTKSLTAFFAVGGWTGLLVLSYNTGRIALSIILALVSGVLAGGFVVLMLRSMMKLQSDGTVRLNALVGKSATVYVSVPANRSGRGKVTLTAQGRYMELDAVTDEDEKLLVDKQVIISESESDFVVVKSLDGKNSVQTEDDKS